MTSTRPTGATAIWSGNHLRRLAGGKADPAARGWLDADPGTHRGDGGVVRRRRRTLRMVAAATRWPRRRSSPWIRVYPHDGLSPASRRISSTSSSPIGGRPGGRGCRHLAATNLRCHRSTVPGATSRWARRCLGSSRISAANNARSVQSSRGVGLVRRSTATSWRNTINSTSLAALLRPSSTEGRPDAETRAHRSPAIFAQVKPCSRVFEPRRICWWATVPSRAS